MQLYQLSPDWLRKNAVELLCNVAKDSDMALRFVGGCVRDSVIGREVHDIDVATTALPDVVTSIYSNAGYKVVPTGVAHGTVTVVIKGHPFEITTLRIDRYCDGRHAEVVYTDDWRQDALRRDFTMNALMMDTDGTVYDYTGGWIDALQGEIRFIGDVDQRIREDHLRILRFFRFYATHGRGELTSEALHVCKNHATKLQQLSIERVAQEMRKLLCAMDPLQALRAMQYNAVLSHIIPNAVFNFNGLDALLALEKQWGAKANLLTRLAAFVGRGAPQLAQHWKFPKVEQRFLSHLIQAESCGTSQQLKYNLYHYGREITLESIILEQAMNNDNSTLMYSQALMTETPPNFPVNGHILRSVGIEPGVAMGTLLKRMEERWIASGFRDGVDELLVSFGLFRDR